VLALKLLKTVLAHDWDVAVFVYIGAEGLSEGRYGVCEEKGNNTKTGI